MKTLIFSFAMLLLATSCGDVYYVTPVTPDPVYDPRDLFIGSYSVDEYNGSDGRYSYSLSVYGGDGYSILISNLFDAGITVRASVQDNRLYISQQFIDGYEISGSGSTDGNTMLINYYITDNYQPGAPTIYCQAIARFY